MALLDLQARIAEELKPDYLLIDARTGVTELGGLATTVLADMVVCLFGGNRESVDGTRAVVEALRMAQRFAGQKPIRVVPVLSRTNRQPQGDPVETAIASLMRVVEPEPLSTLPHDDVIGFREILRATVNTEWSPLYKAYLDLFERLLPSAVETRERAIKQSKPTRPSAQSRRSTR